jgi:signal transduction histidine kinase
VLSITTDFQKEPPGKVSFPHKIGRRLTLALGFLIAVVLLVGGFSLYLANSISESTDKIKTITGKIEHTDHLHFLMHHLINQINRAIVFGKDREADETKKVIRELEEHIRHYKDLEAEADLLKARHHDPTFRAIEGELGVLVRLVEKIEGSLAQGLGASQEELVSIMNLDNRMRGRFDEFNHLHNSAIVQELRTSQTKMNIIVGLYIVFLLLGSLGLIGWSWVVSKNIVSPIRHLASAADEVARGNFDKRVAVASKDEIGHLAHSFNFMAERLRDHEEKLKGLATLEERERIAQELHDSLAQDVGLIHLKIAEAEQVLRTGDASSAKETLKEMRKTAGEAYDNVRQAIFGLRTMVSKSLGFIPTLTEYLHDFSEQRGIAVDLKVSGNGDAGFSAQAEIQLIRIIHEALTNVFKHAGATRSEVRFEREGKFSKVIIEDNGKGFRLGEVMENGLQFGLKTMEERARVVNGDLKIETEPGKGTRVIVLLPLEEKIYGKSPCSPG